MNQNPIKSSVKPVPLKSQQIRRLKRKKFLLKIGRTALQIFFFIFLPSLYIGVWNGIRQIVQAAFQGNFSMALFPQIVEVIAVVPVTMLLGRFFCGWMCAFGSFLDFVYAVFHKIRKRKFKISEAADRQLKYLKYVILLFLAVAVWGSQTKIFQSASPWDVFGMLATVGKVPDFSYVAANLTAGLLIFLGILVASALVERFFCRYLCPLGAVFSLVSRWRTAKIEKPSAQCGSCRACTGSCSMGIPLYRMETVTSGECINCMKCVSVCPRGNAHLSVAQKKVKPMLAGTAAAAVIAGIAVLGNFTANLSRQPAAAAAPDSSVTSSAGVAASGSYRDGTYEGSGTGFQGGTTTVSVTIQSGKIAQITTVSHQDSNSFYDRAYSVISGEILSRQTSEVDGVSGATYSSNGIKEAVADALGKARKA